MKEEKDAWKSIDKLQFYCFCFLDSFFLVFFLLSFFSFFLFSSLSLSLSFSLFLFFFFFSFFSFSLSLLPPFSNIKKRNEIIRESTGNKGKKEKGKKKERNEELNRVSLLSVFFLIMNKWTNEQMNKERKKNTKSQINFKNKYKK